MKVIISRKLIVSEQWKDVNTADYRNYMIELCKLDAVESWLRDRDLTLNMENVRHKDATGHYIVNIFYAELTLEQQIEMQLTLEL
jgi:hypothetical protein